MGYEPSKENAEWLNYALERIKALPYPVTARWVFYRVLREFGFGKKDYKKFLSITSKARKNYWNGWTPETLPDDTRTTLNPYGLGYDDVNAWFDSMSWRSPKLMVENDQEYIVFVCFEARAMVGQFQHYLDKYRVCMFPFGGDPSIPFKYSLAQAIREAVNEYGKPVKILYFGDYDPKGMEIPENAMKDIRIWSGVDFEYIRLGINDDHVKELDIDEDPDHPGKFQWEALDEDAAERLITKVFDYWDKDVIDNIKALERKAGRIWSDVVSEAIRKAKEMLGDE